MNAKSYKPKECHSVEKLPEEFPDEKKVIEKEFDIDFDGHVMTRIKVTGNIQVIAAMNGYGNGIPINRIHVIEITKDK